jgi:hypothetical protein
MSSIGKYLPVPGNLHFVVGNNSTFNVRSVLKLLPGSQIKVEQGGTLNIMSNGKIIVLNNNEYSYSNNTNKYPAGTDYANTGYYGYGTSKSTGNSEIPSYRFPVTLGYSRFDSAIVDNKGIINVYGGIAGKISSSTNNGVVYIHSGYTRSITILDLNNDAAQANATYTLKDGRGNVINPGPGRYVLAENGDRWTAPIRFVKMDGASVMGEETIVYELGQTFVPSSQWFSASLDTYSAESGGYLITSSEMPATTFNGFMYDEMVQFINATNVTITFNVNNPDATVSPSTITQVSGHKINPKLIPTPTPSTGFFGWYADQAGNTPFDFDSSISANTTIWAKWMHVSITISRNPTGDLEKGGTTQITATVKDGNGDPMNNIEVKFSTTSGSISSPSVYTDGEGQATVTFTMATSDATITATEQLQSKSIQTTVNYDSGSISPFIYSEDENGERHREHQPTIYNVLKAVEGTSYGTIKYLQAQNGSYYIQIIEEGDSVTIIDNMKLFAVDYIDDGTVLDLMYDLAGNPHTIRERISPNSFVDQYGNSHLDAIIAKDDQYLIIEDYDADPITYLTASFTRPEGSQSAKLMLSTLFGNFYDRKHHLLTRMYDSFYGQQNWWIIDQAMQYDQYHSDTIQSLIDVAKIQIEVFDGQKWVNKGMIGANANWIEEKLITLDLSDIPGTDLQVRFVIPSRLGYTFDYVAIDFTEDLPMIVHELELISATLNGTEDVLNIVNSIDQNYMPLYYKNGIRFEFAYIPLAPGYSRGFGVSESGYNYSHEAQVYDELQPLMEGKTFEEIKQIILDSGREELIAYLPQIEAYYNMVMYSPNLTYEEKVAALYELYYQE